MPDTTIQRVAAIAEQQAAAISLLQLRNEGLGAADVRRWLLAERILRTDVRTVYRMPGAERTWEQALWVAILAGPKGTLASHTTAAALWGLIPPPTVPHVTVPKSSSGRFQGALVHHGIIDSADRCRFQRVPSTRLGRTIVDCASLLDQDALDGLIDAAIGRGVCRYGQITAAQARAGRVRGGDRLRGALAPYAGGARPRSVKEAHILRLFHSWGLPAPETQYVLRDERGRFIAKLDFAWAPWRFGLEYDGDEFHSPRRWVHDDRRQASIERLCWRIERADRGDLRPSATRLRALLTGILLERAA